MGEGNQERLPILAEELARLPLDVIVTTPPLEQPTKFVTTVNLKTARASARADEVIE